MYFLSCSIKVYHTKPRGMVQACHRACASKVPRKGGKSKSSSMAAATKDSWKKSMRNALRAAPQRQLKVKALRKAVLAEHAKSHPGADGKEAKRSFKERLKKDDNIVKEGKVLRLK